jgi:DnaJ domain
MNETPRFVYDIPVKPREPLRRAAKSVRACAVKGCPECGEYRAPKSRQLLDDYQWLCLNHVRAHNMSWDFFSGMSEAEVAHYIQGNVTGHRPTWALGEKTAQDPRRAGRAFSGAFRDNFGVFGGVAGFEGRPRGEAPNRTRLQRDALGALDLDEDASLNEVKARYKELVKRFHPDANGGDRSCEEQLKRVIRAYRTLKASNFA